MAELSGTPRPDPPEPPSSDSTTGGAEIDETGGDGETQDTTESEATKEYVDQVDSDINRTGPEEDGLPTDVQAVGEGADVQAVGDEVDAEGADDEADAEGVGEGTDNQDAGEQDEHEGGEVQEDKEAAEAGDGEDGGDSQDRESEPSGMNTGEAAKEFAVQIGSTVAGRELGLPRFYENGIKPFIDTIRALGGPRGAVAALRAYASRLFRGGHGGGG